MNEICDRVDLNRYERCSAPATHVVCVGAAYVFVCNAHAASLHDRRELVDVPVFPISPTRETGGRDEKA